MEGMKVPVHVEVEMMPQSFFSQDAVETGLRDMFQKSFPFFREGEVSTSNLDFSCEISRVFICDLGGQEVPFWKAELIFYVYRNIEGDPEKDFLEGEDELPACDQWELPNKALSRLWESIVVESHIKSDILGYATSAMIFTAAMVDPDIISWNRMMLLHGPPGSGKTTLCKAIAQKVFLRSMAQYGGGGFLLEVNSHSLFSKWFSESGKLVMKLFDHINEIADDPQCFVCILIDEVESISSSRTSSMSNNEPGDAVRVVNAVLTSLDALKRRSNVLVLCTSNMQSAIDPAFLDRVDLQVFLGPPSAQARYSILRSCLQELSQKSIISPPCSLAEINAISPHRAAVARFSQSTIPSKKINPLDAWAGRTEEAETEMVTGADIPAEEEGVMRATYPCVSTGSHEARLLDIALRCEGYSGRALRKLPLKAHAIYLQRRKVSLDQYLNAIASTITEHKEGV